MNPVEANESLHLPYELYKHSEMNTLQTKEGIENLDKSQSIPVAVKNS